MGVSGQPLLPGYTSSLETYIYLPSININAFKLYTNIKKTLFQWLTNQFQQLNKFILQLYSNKLKFPPYHQSIFRLNPENHKLNTQNFTPYHNQIAIILPQKIIAFLTRKKVFFFWFTNIWTYYGGTVNFHIYSNSRRYHGTFIWT